MVDAAPPWSSPTRELTAERLDDEVGALLGDPERLAAMAEASADWPGRTRRGRSRTRCSPPAGSRSCPRVRGPAGSPLRRHRRGGDERLGARGGAARRERHRLGPGGVAGAGEAARPGIPALVGHDAANVPEGVESSSRPRSRPTTRSVVAARAAAGRLLARAERAEAVDRHRRRPREDHDHRDDRPRAARRGRGPGVPDRRRAAGDGRPRRLGAGEWLVVEADESDSRCWRSTPRWRS